MHIMITTRCNMTCAHCCYACLGSGENMDFITFRAAAKLAIKLNDRVALAGGEPTTHPLFWDFLGYAIGVSDDVYVQTNGKKTIPALALAKMARAGLITAGISQDEWHDPIKGNVVEAFRKNGQIDYGIKSESGRLPPPVPYPHDDKRFIRDISLDPDYGPQKAGRCDWGVEMCPCCGTSWMDILGGIHQCGCEDAPLIGSVDKPDEFIEKYKYFEWVCWKGLPNPDKKVRKAHVA